MNRGLHFQQGHLQKSMDLIIKSAFFFDSIMVSALGRSLYSICRMDFSSNLNLWTNQQKQKGNLGIRTR